MILKSVRDPLQPDCPIRNVLSRIGDKWSMLTLFTLQRGEVMRFNELQRAIPDISQKMLTATLRALEQDGLLSRTLYAEVPPRVEYRLTDRGTTLLPHLNALIQWAGDQMPAIVRSRAKARKAAAEASGRQRR